jgi:hypothetical protein
MNVRARIALLRFFPKQRIDIVQQIAQESIVPNRSQQSTDDYLMFGRQSGSLGSKTTLSVS